MIDGQLPTLVEKLGYCVEKENGLLIYFAIVDILPVTFQPFGDGKY
jgi:hypothetical protein